MYAIQNFGGIESEIIKIQKTGDCKKVSRNSGFLFHSDDLPEEVQLGDLQGFHCDSALLAKQPPRQKNVPIPKSSQENGDNNHERHKLVMQTIDDISNRRRRRAVSRWTRDVKLGDQKNMNSYQVRPPKSKDTRTVRYLRLQ